MSNRTCKQLNNYLDLQMDAFVPPYRFLRVKFSPILVTVSPFTELFTHHQGVDWGPGNEGTHKLGNPTAKANIVTCSVLWGRAEALWW